MKQVGPVSSSSSSSFFSFPSFSSLLVTLLAASFLLIYISWRWIKKIRVTLWPTLSIGIVDVDLQGGDSNFILKALNRLIQGALPLKVEQVLCTDARVSLPWEEVFRIRSWRIELVELTLRGRMTHVEEWDEARMLAQAVRLKRQESDLTTLLVEEHVLLLEEEKRKKKQEGENGRTHGRAFFLRWLDHLLAGLQVDLLTFHLCIKDNRSESCMGLGIDRVSCAPSDLSPTPGTVPRRIEVVEARLYVDPILSTNTTTEEDEDDTHMYIAKIGQVTAELGLPDIGAVLLAPGRRPGGASRRLTVSGVIQNLRGQLRPVQMHHFIFHLLHVFYGGPYRAWRSAMIVKHREGCRRLQQTEREHYMELDRKLHVEEEEEQEVQQQQLQQQDGQHEQRVQGQDASHAQHAKRPSKKEKERRRKELLASLEMMEEVMTYAEIVHLRCEARSWGGGLVEAAAALADGGAQQPTMVAGLPVVAEEELLVHESHPLAAEFQALATLLPRVRAQYMHDNKTIREFHLESARVEHLAIECFTSAREKDGHTMVPLSFEGDKEATIYAGYLACQLRLLMAMDPHGTAAGVGGLVEEPDQGWFQIGVQLGQFCLVNEAVESLSKHVTSFLLCGPFLGDGGPQQQAAVGGAGGATAGDVNNTSQVAWIMRLWSSGRHHESLSFKHCRVSGYISRLIFAIRTIITPFRPPLTRFWTEDHDYAAYWVWAQNRQFPEDLTRVGLSLSGEGIPRPTSFSSSPVACDDDSQQPQLAAGASVGGGAMVSSSSSSPLAVKRLLAGWFLRFAIDLDQCEVVLVANPEDAESALLVAEVTASALISSQPNGNEGIELQIASLALVPALSEKESCQWIVLEAMPPTLPMSLYESQRGFLRAERRLLEPLQASLRYLLEPGGKGTSSSLAVTEAAAAAVEEEKDGSMVLYQSPSRRRRMSENKTESPWDADAGIPRYIWLLLKEARFELEDEEKTETTMPAEALTSAGAAGKKKEKEAAAPAAKRGPVSPGLIVRCGRESQVLRRGGKAKEAGKSKQPPASVLLSEAGLPSTLPAFDAVVEFITGQMNSQGGVEVVLEVVDLAAGEPSKEEDWNVVATGSLLLDPPQEQQEEEDEDEGRDGTNDHRNNNGRRRRQVAVLTGLGPWEGMIGRLEVEFELGLRLLNVTVHRMQHLLTLSEETGREIRPFLEVTAGHLHSQTDQLSGFPEEDIEHEMIFAVEELEPALCVELKTLEGRVHERTRAQATLPVGLREKEQEEWLPLRDAKGTVVCELSLSVQWIDSSQDIQSSLVAAGVAAAPGPMTMKTSTSGSQRLSFNKALEAFRRQAFVVEPQAAVVQTVAVDLSELILHTTEMDLAMLSTLLQDSRSNKPSSGMALQPTQGGGGGRTLPRRLSRVNSLSQLKEGPEGDARERWWKRTIYRLFKELDEDKDGRLTRPQLIKLLESVSTHLYLTHSEATVQIEHLLSSMGWSEKEEEEEEGGEERQVSWPGFREALERAVEVYEFDHAGWLFSSVRCREYTALTVIRKLFPSLPLPSSSSSSSSSSSASSRHVPLTSYLARLDPGPPDPLAQFWHLFEKETGARRGDGELDVQMEPGQSPSYGYAALQAMLVRCLKNYKMAREVWRLLLVPALHGLPALRKVDREGWDLLGAPVAVGDNVYSDMKGAELVALPQPLAAEVLTGLRSPHRDRKTKGPRLVSFHLSEKASVFVCYDRRIPKIPAWLTDAGFRDTRMFVRTTVATYRVWTQMMGPGYVTLGGNEGFGKGKGREKHAFECMNYFVLVGRPRALSSSSSSSSSLTTAQQQQQSLPTRWLLQENNPAYWGLPLHDHLFGALAVGGAKLPPLKIKDVVGGTSSSSSNNNNSSTSTITNDETLLIQPQQQQQPQRIVYEWHLQCPRLFFGLLDFRKLRASKLAVWSRGVSANVSLERPLNAEESSWLGLGRTDRLEGDLELACLAASYFNPALAAPEHVIEPWGCSWIMRNHLDSAITTVCVDAPRHLNVNVSPTLSEVLRAVVRPLRFNPRRFRSSFEETPSSIRRIARVVLVNRLGVPMSIRSTSQGCKIVGVVSVPNTPTSAAGQGQEGPRQEQDSVTPQLSGSAPDPSGSSEERQLLVLEEGQRVVLELEQETHMMRGPTGARQCHFLEVEPFGWQKVGQIQLGFAGSQAYHLSSIDHRRPTSRSSKPPQPPPPPSSVPPSSETGEGGGDAASKGQAQKRSEEQQQQQQPHQHHQHHHHHHHHRHRHLPAQHQHLQNASQTDVSLSQKIFMVVDAKEPPVATQAEASTGQVTTALLVEVRTNVRLVNVSSVAVDARLGRGGDGVRSMLYPQAAMAMPLSIVRQQPMLSLRRLRPEQERSALLQDQDSGPGIEDSVLLHPALFDARTHDALRRTRGLEERSLSLHYRVLGMATVSTALAGPAAPSPLPETGREESKVTTYTQAEGGRGQETAPEQSEITPEKARRPSPVPEHDKRSPLGSKSHPPAAVVAVDWTLAVLPPYQLINTLPCRLVVEVFQPKQLPRSRHTRPRSRNSDGERGGTSLDFSPSSSPSVSGSAASRKMDPASDLFSLPLGLMDSEDRGGASSKGGLRSPSDRTQDEEDEEGGREDRRGRDRQRGREMVAVVGPTEDMEMVWAGRLESGNHANLEFVKLDRVLYVRVRLMGETRLGPWSIPVHIPSWTHLDRLAFNEDREASGGDGLEVSWRGADAGGGAGLDYHGDIRLVTRWRLKGARRLAVCAPYWFVNKTGLSLAYQPTLLPEKTKQRTSRAPSPQAGVMASETTTTAATTATISTTTATAVEQESASKGGADRTTSPADQIPQLSVIEQEQGQSVVGLLEDGGVESRRVISDGTHRERFGPTTRLPLMLDCPAKTLRVMSYALAEEALSAQLYLTELRVEMHGSGAGTLPAVAHRCRDLEEEFPLFTDSDLRAVELPPPLQKAVQAPGGGLLCVLRDRWRRDLSLTEQQEQQQGAEVTTFSVSEDAYVYALCCVKGDEEREQNDARPLPAWLAHEGFRVPAHCGAVETSEPSTRYVPYRRFYSKGSLVRLGGPRRSGSVATGTAAWGMDISQSTGDRSSSMMAGPTTDPGGNLLPPPVPISGQAAAEGGEMARPEASRKKLKSPRLKANDAVEVQIVVAVAYATPEEAKMELDVHSVDVQRSLSDRLLCSRRYALLPGFGVGDPLYVDRKVTEYALEGLPAPLADQPLLAIQTAQGDKRGGSSFVLTFTVRRPCVVMVGYDSRAKSSVPDWLARLGFQATEWTIPVTKGDFHYNLYRRTLPAQATIKLGGNNAPGARGGAKAMYLVLLAPLASSLSPTPLTSPTLKQQQEQEQHHQQEEEEEEELSSIAMLKGEIRGENDSFQEERFLDDSGDGTSTPITTTPTFKEDLTLFWDSQRYGRMKVLAPLFDTLGRDWSAPFNVEAISTNGQVETPSAVLGVSVKSLPGLFHRTRVVTLWPRFVVINRLDQAVDVLPLLNPATVDDGRAPRNVVVPNLLRPSASSVLTEKKKGKGTAGAGENVMEASRGGGDGGRNGHLDSTECYGVLGPGESLVVFGFLPLRYLPSSLLLSARLKEARAAAVQRHQHHYHHHLGQGHKEEDKRDGASSSAHALSFRLHHQQALDEQERVAFSHAVSVEEVGETCVWLWRDAGGRCAGPLVSANVNVHGATVFVTLRDSTLSPPYRIENRSSWAKLLCKQSGNSDEMLSVGPMAFKSFSWQERDYLHQLRVSVEGYESEAVDFALDEVGPKETLVVGNKTFLAAGLAVASSKGRRQPSQRLYVHVSTAGRTRVITFSDKQKSEWRAPQKEMGLSSWSWTLFQELYNSLDVRIVLAGLSLNLLDMNPSGRRVVELLSLTLDHLEVSKEGGKDRAQMLIYHVQVDDMRPHAMMPVVLQPLNSGWNGPGQEFPDSGGMKKKAVVVVVEEEEGERKKKKPNKKKTPPAVFPLIRVMAEPELHSPWSEVVHFRALEFGIQELELKLDLDAVMSMVAYIGRLLAPESEREEGGRGNAGTASQQQQQHHHHHHHHPHHHQQQGRRNALFLSQADDKSLALVRRLLRSKLSVPDAACGDALGNRLVYIELFHHSSLVVQMELVAGGVAFARKEKSNKVVRLGELDPDLDEALVSGLEIIGTGVVQLLVDMARSLAQLSGLTLVFNELLLTHYFGSHYELGHVVAVSFRQQALTQSYKLLGAMDLLGNPLNLFLGLGSGVVEFFRKTQSELVGDSDSKGEGLRKLAKAAVLPFSSISKITGTVASLLEEVVGVREAMGGTGATDEFSGGPTGQGGGGSGGGGGGGGSTGGGSNQPGGMARPQHLGEGLMKGGEVFYRSMKSGVKNIYDLPQQGASRDGFTGFLKGMGKGVVGALAAPLIGTLGGISRVTDTTYYFDTPRVIRRRREARVVPPGRALPLLELEEESEAAGGAGEGEGNEREEER